MWKSWLEHLSFVKLSHKIKMIWLCLSSRFNFFCMINYFLMRCFVNTVLQISNFWKPVLLSYFVVCWIWIYEYLFSDQEEYLMWQGKWLICWILLIECIYFQNIMTQLSRFLQVYESSLTETFIILQLTIF